MQKNGIKHGLSLFMFNSIEKNIIYNISKLWYITFAKKSIFKNTEYLYIFAKPTDNISEQFHLSREILIIFSQFESFAPRTLDFVDKIMEEFSNRLDKLCVIIVSNDENIEDKISNIIMQDQESRILIPYTYTKLFEQDKTIEIQMSKLKQSFYERDLFAYETPLKNDIYFFGRQSIIQNLYGKYQTGQCGSLFGLRRIGKTSSIFAVMRMMKMRNEPVVYIDCSETSLHKRRWNEALYFIILQLSKKLDNRLKLHREDRYTEKDASLCFEEDLTKIYNSQGKKRILIILDEIENITFDISPTEHWKKDLDFISFWQVLRSVFQKKNELFSFIVAGVNPKLIETSTVHGHDNPIYRFIEPTYLPFFNNDDVKQMVSTIGLYMGMSFDDEVFTYLTDDFGGHPFLIRQVCSKLFQKTKNNRPANITKYLYAENRAELNRAMIDYLDLIISVLEKRYPDEYELITYLAHDDNETFKEFVTISPKFIEHLQGYGLIKEENGNFYFKIKSIKKYIQEKTKIIRKYSTKEEKLARVSKLRNKLEDELRLLVNRTLKYRLGEKKAKDTLLSIISPPKRKEKLQTLPYNQIFKSTLYFEDIRKVIEKNWTEFEIIFNKDKGKFKQHMEFINSHRVDAHANEIDDSDLAILEISIDWIQKHISNYIE